MTTRTPYTVLLICGAGRSGSTLLERMLDQVPGVVAVGELTDLWDSALVRGERCGCGVPFAKCEFWSHVGDHAFGGWHRIDAGELLAVHDSVARNRHVPLLLTAPLLPSVKEKVDRYAAAFSRIYGGIVAASGSNLIVDASKWASHALVLRRIPGLDLRMVHLVRDPRAVAHSWATSVERPQALGRSSGVEMRRYRPTASALHWTTINVGIDIASALGIPRHFLRYEQLIASPRETLLGALEHAGLVPAEGGSISSTTGSSGSRRGMSSPEIGSGSATARSVCARTGGGQPRCRGGHEWPSTPSLFRSPSRIAVVAIEEACCHAARIPLCAAVAQLARASACHAEGRGFESHQPLSSDSACRQGNRRSSWRSVAARPVLLRGVSAH